MIYKIDYSNWFEEGGYCQLYPIKDNPSLGFKEFLSKNKALKAHALQKKLSKFDLAPKVFSNISKLEMVDDQDQDFTLVSDWGYVTELAKTQNKFALKDIQQLVGQIYKKTNLKFWDCHYHNLGWISRGHSKKLVCIDTGTESFNGIANAWGNVDPGPKCSYCLKYKCSCEE